MAKYKPCLTEFLVTFLVCICLAVAFATSYPNEDIDLEGEYDIKNVKDLDVDEDANIDGDLAVGGDTDTVGDETVGGNSTVTGIVTALNFLKAAGFYSIDTTVAFYLVDGKIAFQIAGIEQIYVVDGAVMPTTDTDIDLGSSGLKFNAGYFVSVTASDTVTGGTLTDSTTSITGGNYTGVGNVSGSDVDISAGTGDYTSTGYVRATILQLISALYSIYEDNSDMFLNSPAILNAISLAQIEGALNKYAIRDLYNGSAKEAFNALVTSDGATVTLTVTNAAGGDLTMQFSDGDSTLTGGSTIALTAGSDVSPTDNFIYVLQSDPTTLVKSTSSFPTTLEHNKIGYFLVPSAGFSQTNGVYINQNWNDAISGTDNQGHLLHMAERSRRLGAQYFSGVDGNGTDGYLTPTAGNVELKSTAGVIYQMHRQTIAAFDTYSNDLVLVANWSGDAFHDITNLYDITTDSTGATIGNNKFFNLVVWGVGNKTGEYGPMMINLPGGFYNKVQQAKEDVSGYDNFSISREFSLESSTGFLIARITIQMKTAGGTWVVDSTTDLRGQTPNTASGGVGSIRDEFADNTFRIFDDSDNSKEGAFDIGTGVATGTTRTVQWPNVDTLMWADNGSVPLTANWNVGAYNITTAANMYGLDQVYSISWDGEESFPTKNSVYDKIESLVIENLLTSIATGDLIYRILATNTWGILPVGTEGQIIAVDAASGLYYVDMPTGGGESTTVTAPLVLTDVDISIPAATNSVNGYATSAHITAIEANTLKDTNVTTNLSAGTRAPTTIDVNSSDGTNATLVEADTTNAGILGSDKWDEIVANSLKTSNATHTGDVTGATALTIGANKILESMLKSVNAPTDEYALTYEETTGDFEWQVMSGGSPGAYVGRVTRDMTTASGTQTVTGVGFTPQSVIFLANQTGTTEFSIGFGQVGTNWCVFADDPAIADTWSFSGDCMLLQQVSGAINYGGDVTTFNSDGFIITWVKAGAKTGTAQVLFLALE